MSKWIKVTDKLPANEQRILTCYYDESIEDYQISLLTYYKKGTVIDTRIDRDPNHSLTTKLLNSLFNKEYDIIAKEDGFYIDEWDSNGDASYRKHKDCITHWQSLTVPK